MFAKPRIFLRQNSIQLNHKIIAAYANIEFEMEHVYKRNFFVCIYINKCLRQTFSYQMHANIYLRTIYLLSSFSSHCTSSNISNHTFGQNHVICVNHETLRSFQQKFLSNHSLSEQIIHFLFGTEIFQRFFFLSLQCMFIKSIWYTKLVQIGNLQLNCCLFFLYKILFIQNIKKCNYFLPFYIYNMTLIVLFETLIKKHTCVHTMCRRVRRK